MTNSIQQNSILILDFGSQYTQLIARRVRELGVYCEIVPFNTPIEKIVASQPKGIILSGSPSSVYEIGSPRLDQDFVEQIDCPVLGICYGVQLLAQMLGGKVERAAKREYGFAQVRIATPESLLFRDVAQLTNVWMSHGDEISEIPDGFRITASAGESLSAIESLSRCIYGLQFHPEVAHSSEGKQMLKNFLLSICSAKANWTPSQIIKEQVENIRSVVGEDGKVICGLSGGVDSTVAAVLVDRAVGLRQTCIFVNSGLLRDREFEMTGRLFRENLHLNVNGVDASAQFLEALGGVVDPEQKRREIGRVFVEVFEEQAQAIGGVDYLVQGTLYPDVIESVSVNGPSSVIKTHHNVGGLPERMRLKLIEPLRALFKDEVRTLGRELGIPEFFLERHPFPGPGLAVRILGDVTPERLAVLRKADRIVEEEIRGGGYYERVWQAFPVLLPVMTVGVMGDYRTYEQVVALRVVESVDGMTADWARLPHELLANISSRLIAEVRGVNRVVYDISSKPPSTIEWE